MAKTAEAKYLEWASLVPEFGGVLQKAKGNLSSAELYHSLLKIEKNPFCLGQAYSLIEKGLVESRNCELRKSFNLSNLNHNEFVAALLSETKNYLGLIQASSDKSQDFLLLSFLKELAPSACLQGSWLQHACRLNMCETPMGANFLKQYALYLGVVESKIPSGEKYETLLKSNKIDVPSLSSSDFFESLKTSDYSQENGILDLAISYFPRTFLPELVGYNLWKTYFSYFDLIPLLSSDDWLDLADTEKMHVLAVQNVQEILNLKSEDMTSRMMDGFCLAHLAYQKIRNQILLSTVHDEIALLFSRKRQYMVGHHQNVFLEGKCLDDWHSEPIDDFIRALIKAKWIYPGDTSKSRFLRLLEFSGPMFGVFSADETKSIADWIKVLTPDNFKVIASTKTSLAWNVDLKGLESESFEKRSTKFWKKVKTERQIFYHLINYDIFPVIRPAALEATIRMTNKQLGDEKVPKFSEESLESIIDSRFQIENRRYELWREYQYPKWQDAEESAKTKMKIEIAKGIMRSTPTALTDGSWMQGGCDIAMSGNEASRILFKTFYEEMGEGKLEWNHVVIHRNAMLKMGIELPDLTDPEFPHFFPRGTRFPTWLLLVGTFSQQFFPEALGMNIAIEPFGVGGLYRIQEEFWGMFGFDTTNARVHNSIDNQASGHSRLAVRAIQFLVSYSDSFTQEDEANPIWQRVWRAYQATDSMLEGAST